MHADEIIYAGQSRMVWQGRNEKAFLVLEADLFHGASQIIKTGSTVDAQWTMPVFLEQLMTSKARLKKFRFSQAFKLGWKRSLTRIIENIQNKIIDMLPNELTINQPVAMHNEKRNISKI
jgi:hypothetical protein